MAKWINKPPSEAFLKEPWMYQGASDGFLAPTGDIPAITEDWGIDYEAEVAIITDAVPCATRTKDAGQHICLVMLCNDVSLRNLIPAELAKGFGFVQSKPASAFSPVAVTPDELGDAWQDYRLSLPLLSYLNEELYGMPNAGEMAHGFDRLVAHAAKTRSLSAGTIIGGGTVANENPAKGTSCLVERRVLEILEHGGPKTTFLKFGDRVRIEMLDREGHSIFGAIEQRVTKVSVCSAGGAQN
jgi:fumarylacetoacetate (FAA) hydrolase